MRQIPYVNSEIRMGAKISSEAVEPKLSRKATKEQVGARTVNRHR